MTTTQLVLAFKRGDVVLVLFPNSDLRTAKPRPALVIQADGLATGLNQTVVAMVTSRMFRAGPPSRVPVLIASPDGADSGLLADSVVMADNLATVTSSAVSRVIGHIPMQSVDAALRHTLGL